jgi:putative peptidoglycan lipid II flippase
VKQKVRYFFVWDLKDPGLHAVLRLLIPSLLAVAVTSIGAVIDIAFTSFFRDKGSIAALNNAELLFALPVALLGQVVPGRRCHVYLYLHWSIIMSTCAS